MPKFTIEAANRKTIEMALDMAIASNRRAINASRRPEFNVVYEKEITDLQQAKSSLEPTK